MTILVFSKMRYCTAEHSFCLKQIPGIQNILVVTFHLNTDVIFAFCFNVKRDQSFFLARCSVRNNLGIGPIIYAGEREG